jgi:hypothetical protein
MGLAPGWRHDVFHRSPPHRQRIRDQRAMTSPRDRFGTHHGEPVGFCELDEVVEVVCKCRRLHVVGIAPERVVAPSGVQRIGKRPAQPPEPRHRQVTNADLLQRFRERRLVELRIAPRTRDRPHIDNARDLVGLEQAKKLIKTPGGMPDGQNRRRHLGSPFCSTPVRDRAHGIMTPSQRPRSVLVSVSRADGFRTGMRFEFFQTLVGRAVHDFTVGVKA